MDFDNKVLIEWLTSDKGQTTLSQAIHDAQKAITHLENERQVRPEDLSRPLGPLTSK